MQPPHPPYGGQPQPGPGTGGHGSPPGPYGPPGWVPPPPKPSNGGAIVIIIALAMVALAGGGAGVWWLMRTTEVPSRPIWGAPMPSQMPYLPSPPVSPSPPPGGPPPTPLPSDGHRTPTGKPSRSPGARSSVPAAYEPKTGDCVRNAGSYASPVLEKARCTSGHYRILHRYNGTTSRGRCLVGTYAVWYTDPKFILCLRPI